MAHFHSTHFILVQLRLRLHTCTVNATVFVNGIFDLSENFNGDFDGYGDVDITCKQSFATNSVAENNRL